MVIDVGLLYASNLLVKGFEVPGPLYAVLTAVLINAICAVAAGALVGRFKCNSL